jgi:hypothetical protein
MQKLYLVTITGLRKDMDEVSLDKFGKIYDRLTTEEQEEVDDERNFRQSIG